MKLLGIITLILLSINCIGQDQEITNQLIEGEKEGYWIEKDSTGMIINEGLYKTGIKEGTWKEYSKDTPSVFVGIYKNGLRDGDWSIISTEDGTELDIQKYQNGKITSKAIISW